MPVPTLRSPRRVVARTLGLGVSALVAAGLLAWTPTASSAWNQGSAEATLWQLLNGARANNGVRVLQQHSTLIGLARWRSSDMLAKDYFSHTIAGCGCLVYAYYDSNGLNYGWAGENIGWNSGLDDSYSPVRVHEAFMGSAGHRANVLDARFTHGGVGAAAADGKMFQGHVQNTRMYTELFMEAAGSAPAPAPAPPPPAPRPPSGGGGSTVPAQPTPTPAPTAKEVSVDAPRRPTSTAGLDGMATVVRDATADRLTGRLMVDEASAARVAAQAAGATAAAPSAPEIGTADLEVTAASSEPGFFDGIVGALLGLLFG
jgi:uncharacterized protein YkwD